MSYKTGDTLVHPQHGVGKVDGPPVVASNGQSYLSLFFEPSSLKIMIPVDSLEEVGIRPVASADHAQHILETLAEASDVPAEWSERNASTVARVKSTDLDQAALVIRDLTRHQLRTSKPLSAAEKGVLDRCIEMVAQELSIVLAKTPDEVRALIDEKISQGSPAQDSEEQVHAS